MNFYQEIFKILESFNVYPRAKAIQGRQAPVQGKNVNFNGVAPMGFKGSNTGQNSTLLVKWPKKKRRKKTKKKKDSSL
jgi:hypothetical protein